MRYNILLATLLTASTVFGAEVTTQRVDAIDAKVDRLGSSVDSRVGSLETRVDAKLNALESRLETQATEATQQRVLAENKKILIGVVGQGVAPMNTTSPAQAYALAKRAAVADAYRLIAEKVKGVKIDGQDLIQNMMVKRSTIRTSVNAMIRNANVVETTFKDGLCEVEMEISLSHSQFTQ